MLSVLFSVGAQAEFVPAQSCHLSISSDQIFPTQDFSFSIGVRLSGNFGGTIFEYPIAPFFVTFHGTKNGSPDTDGGHPYGSPLYLNDNSVLTLPGYKNVGSLDGSYTRSAIVTDATNRVVCGTNQVSARLY